MLHSNPAVSQMLGREVSFYDYDALFGDKFPMKKVLSLQRPDFVSGELTARERILELYLNVAEWGNGIYGAEAAARHYFGKSAAALTTYEAASMAAILPAPLKRTPSSPLVRRLAARLVKRIPLY